MNEVIVPCHWCKEPYAYRPKVGPVDDAYNKVLYHNKCKREYHSFATRFNKELQELRGKG